MSLLSVRNLRIYYSSSRGIVRAVDGVTFDIEREETLGIVGESGCGKSTLAMGLLDILPPSANISGEIILDGENILEKEKEYLRKIRHEKVALIFQDPMTRLDPLMKIKDHFLETFRSHKRDVKEEEALRIAGNLMNSVGLSPEVLDYYPHELSGGMRQRAMIALALVFNPQLLIADEPTTSLDVIVEAQILQLMNKIKKEFHMSIILITHNLGIVAEMADRVAVMYAGKIVEIGSLANIFTRPLHPYTRGLLGSVITLESRELVTMPGEPPDLINPPKGCRFAPRCPYAIEMCMNSEPSLQEAVKGHSVACFRALELMEERDILYRGDIAEKAD
ncbi:MAG: ABC transporter ATP-binding protein [Thermoplasmata archaeon]|jgi:peptide/nickel transport system ATP-binding protein|nr:ABC transporter ATP-binding protein [Thermoplasmatales archaeon]